MADKKQKYKRYYTEWDKMSSDEKYYDKTNKCNKPTYRNDNNKFQLTKTLMKKYKHKAKPAFDENELKELFQKNDYSEEQISKEINYKLKEINEKGYEFGWHEVKKGKKKNNNFDNEYIPSRTLENFSQRLPKEKYNEYPKENGLVNPSTYRTSFKGKFFKSGDNWNKKGMKGFKKENKIQKRPFTKAFEVPSDPNYNWGENIKIAIERNKRDIEEEKEELQKQEMRNNEIDNNNNVNNIETNFGDDDIQDNNNNEILTTPTKNKFENQYQNLDYSAENNIVNYSSYHKELTPDKTSSQQENKELLKGKSNEHSQNENLDNKERNEEDEEEEEEEEDDDEENEESESGINFDDKEEYMSAEKKNLLRKYYLEKLKVYSSQKNTKVKRPASSKLSDQTSFHTIKSSINALFLSIIVEERNHKGGVISEYVFPFTLDDLKEKDQIFVKCKTIEEAQKVLSPLLKGKMSFNKENDYIELHLIVVDRMVERKILFRLFPQLKDGGIFNQFQKVLLSLNSKLLKCENEIKDLKEEISKKK